MRYATLICLSLALFTSCRRSAAPTEESRDLPAFEQITLRGVGQLRLSQGKQSGLMLTGSGRDLAAIKTEVKDGELIISPKDPLKALVPLVFYATVDKLDEIHLEGAGEVVSEGTLHLNTLKIDLAGTGSVHLTLDARKVDTSISGSGQVYLDGSADEQGLTMTGMGSYDTIDLKSKRAEVRLSGAGNVELGELEELDVKISGTGRVTYAGQPKVSERVLGAGKVEQRAAKTSPSSS